jgi:oligosaccharide repeat unit polymerase
MEDRWLFMIGFILSLVLLYLLIRIVNLSMSRMSIPMIFIWSYIVFGYAGFPLLLFNLVERARWLFFLQDILLMAWLYATIALFMLIIGFIFAKYILQASVVEYDVIPTESVLIRGNVNVFALVILCLLVFISTFIFSRQVSLDRLSSVLEVQNTTGIAQIRGELSEAISSSWRYNLFSEKIASFVSYVALSAYLLTKRRIYSVIWIIATVLVLFKLVLGLNRSSVPLYLGSVMFIYLLTQNKRISPYLFIKSLLSFGMILTAIFSWYGKMSPTDAIMNVFDRLTTGAIGAAYYYVATFPNEVDYLMGSTFPNPGNLLGFERFNITVFISQQINIDQINSGVYIPGSANAPFWAEMLANFGIIGIIVAAFVFGVIMWLVHSKLSRYNKEPVIIALITFIAFDLRDASISSLSPYLFPVELIAVVVVAYILRKVSAQHDSRLGDALPDAAMASRRITAPGGS